MKWTRTPSPEKHANAVLSAAARRVVKMTVPEIGEWFEHTNMMTGALFDQWRRGGPLEELVLSVQVLGVLSQELMMREDAGRSFTSDAPTRRGGSRRRAAQ